MKFPAATLSAIFGRVRFETKWDDKNNTMVNVLTHLQKFSRMGALLHWTFFYFIPIPTFHFWAWIKKQEYTKKSDGTFGGWIPGTERGIYFRTPGHRWDMDLGMKRTLGYFGFHWD